MFWEQHQNAVYNSKQVLEAAFHKTIGVVPLASHLTNHHSKTKIYKVLLMKQERTHK